MTTAVHTASTPPAAASTSPDSPHIRQAVETLATARRNAAARRAALSEARQVFEAEHASLILDGKAADETAQLAEQVVRELVLVHHKTTGDGAPCAGVSIALTTEFKVDVVAGLEWARQTKMALIPESLDLAAVKKIARATALPFVTLLEVPAVRIATDLDKALDAEAVTS